jgi:hypothetical protein
MYNFIFFNGLIMTMTKQILGFFLLSSLLVSGDSCFVFVLFCSTGD